jgi:two-component system alkaline phosphatase synthesis response regulator PhoP
MVSTGSPDYRFAADATGARRVLSVDDEQAILYTRQLLLEAEGYEVLNAADGEQALILFDSNVVDLVLLDYVMPGLDGGAVAEEMKRRRPDVPIIIVSANPILEEDHTCANCIIRKGFGPKPLLDKMKQLLDGGIG